MSEESFTRNTAKPRIRTQLPDPRLIFISHAHADRALGTHLREAIESGFSGIASAYFSSDPSPTGGLMPGDDWYAEIHRQLAVADSVWVLATPYSITRPWIYWEAGIGRATCPGAIVLLRVGLSTQEVPSPLSNFQSYDALNPVEMAQLLAKVGAQLGMKLPQILIDSVAKEWTGKAKLHKPEHESTVQGNVVISPEAVGQLDSLVSRLEQLVAAGARPEVPTPPTFDFEADNRMRKDALGSEEFIYSDAEELLRVFDRAKPGTQIKFEVIDSDRDAQFSVSSADGSVPVWLRSEALGDLPSTPSLSPLGKSLVRQMRAALLRRAQVLAVDTRQDPSDDLMDESSGET